MSKTSLILMLALGLGGGFLIARYFTPEPAPVVVEAPKPVVPERVDPVAKARVPRADGRLDGAQKSEEEVAKEEMRARAKAFMDETRKMVEDIAGGDQAKLQRAMFSGMMKPEGQAIMKEWREFGEAMRNASPAEREALAQQAVALRDRTLNALRAEMAAQSNLAPGAPVAVPAEAGAPAGQPAAQPAPVIIM